MKDDNISKLQMLRSAVLSDLEPIVDSEKLDPEQRFNLYLGSARLSGDSATFEKARAAAADFADSDTKALALLDLLEAIEESMSIIPEETQNDEPAQVQEDQTKPDTKTEPENADQPESQEETEVQQESESESIPVTVGQEHHEESVDEQHQEQ